MRVLSASMVALAGCLALTAGPVRATQWNIETVDHNYARFSSLAVDQNGQVHIAYMGDASPYLRYASGNGGSWTVESPGGFGAYSSLALDREGKPHISYYDGWGFKLRYARKEEGSWLHQTIDNDGPCGSESSIALDADDHPYFSYWSRHGTDTLKCAYYGDGAVTTQVVDAGYFAHTRIGVGADGYPRIACTTSVAGPWEVHYATWDGSDWTVQRIDDGGCTSLAIDRDGYSHITYSRGSESVMHAYETAAGWTTEKVASSGPACGTSMAFDLDGSPCLTYVVEQQPGTTVNGPLMFARKQGSVWTQVQLDVASSDDNTSLAVDSFGNIHVAYSYRTSNPEGITAALRYAIFPVPEPSTILALLFGLGGVVWFRGKQV